MEYRGVGLPIVDDFFIRGTEAQGFEFFGEVIGQIWPIVPPLIVGYILTHYSEGLNTKGHLVGRPDQALLKTPSKFPSMAFPVASLIL